LDDVVITIMKGVSIVILTVEPSSCRSAGLGRAEAFRAAWETRRWLHERSGVLDLWTRNVTVSWFIVWHHMSFKTKNQRSFGARTPIAEPRVERLAPREIRPDKDDEAESLECQLSGRRKRRPKQIAEP